MNSRTLASTALFLAIVAVSILAAVASSVVHTDGADGAPYGWQAQATESRDA